MSAAVSRRCPGPRGRSPRVAHPCAAPPEGGARLACVRRAASVRSEPGSNSQLRSPAAEAAAAASTARGGPRPRRTTAPAAPPARPFPSNARHWKEPRSGGPPPAPTRRAPRPPLRMSSARTGRQRPNMGLARDPFKPLRTTASPPRRGGAGAPRPRPRGRGRAPGPPGALTWGTASRSSRPDAEGPRPTSIPTLHAYSVARSSTKRRAPSPVPAGQGRRQPPAWVRYCPTPAWTRGRAELTLPRRIGPGRGYARI